MKVRFSLYFVVAILILSSCKRQEGQRPDSPDTLELLTEQNWSLLSYGYDHNRDGQVNSNEESIRDCEKDNTYEFNMDGSGNTFENALSCDNNEKVTQFSWALTNDKTRLGFTSGIATILKISNERLILGYNVSEPAKLLVIYGR